MTLDCTPSQIAGTYLNQTNMAEKQNILLCHLIQNQVMILITLLRPGILYVVLT